MSELKSIEQTLAEREDDANELRKSRKRETLNQQIARFLDGGMSANESDALTQDHSAEIDREIRKRESEAARAKQAREENATRKWRDAYTPEELAVAKGEVRAFVANHPNFRGDIISNRDALLHWLKDHSLECTADNLEAAYADLKPRGVFVQFTPGELRLHKMSADQWQASRPELREERLPPLLLRNIDQALATFRAGHPEYIANDSNKTKMIEAWEKTGQPVSVHVMETVFRDLASRNELVLDHGAISQGFAVRLTDLGGRQAGHPTRPEKYSFRKKIESMSASEIADRCLNDTQFKEALDNLE